MAPPVRGGRRHRAHDRLPRRRPRRRRSRSSTPPASRRTGSARTPAGATPTSALPDGKLYELVEERPSSRARAARRGSTRSGTAARRRRHCVLVEEPLDALEHRRALLGGEHGAVAAREHEIAEPLAVELLDVRERAPAPPARTARSPRSASAASRSSSPSLPTTSSLSCATHGSRSSRVFQTSAIRPPGRSTRAISRSAGPWSNQWNACAP